MSVIIVLLDRIVREYILHVLILFNVKMSDIIVLLARVVYKYILHVFCKCVNPCCYYFKLMFCKQLLRIISLSGERP